jgi:putative ABC transport system permease protein
MEGGFNDVVLGMAPGASDQEAIAQLDRILEPYGGLGAIPRALQISNWTLQNELNQLQNFGFMLPLIFLGVAAFVLNVALTRALALQRSQIAALKALGYSNVSLGWHYMKWALLIGAAGVVLGIGLGGYLGSAIGDLYNTFFRFPELLFSIPIEVIVGATFMTLGAASLGAFSAVRRAVRIPPAEAMRPEPPARYRRSRVETLALARQLGTAGRMVLRNVGRRPLRAAVSVVGIGFAVAVLMVGFVFVDAMDRLIVTQFSVVERQDVTVNFVEPRSDAARHALARLPGVIAVEPVRSVAARVRAGHRERYLAITGVGPGARMRRVVDAGGREVRLTPSGVVLSKMLAEVLNISAGDTIALEILEGNRPSITAQVTGLVDDVMGLSVYMEVDDLHRMMREGDVVSAALLLIDPAEETELSRTLKETPAVAGTGFKSAVLRSFRETMAANMNLTIFINLIFAGVIAFGVVYNAARVSLSERSHELASLRVLGFTRAEISLILMEELALLTLLALPVGTVFGYWLSAAIFSTVQSEVYRFPMYISRSAVALACLGVTAAAVISALLVRRRLDQLDLVAVLKVRE